jgi:V8-like Glu-specific endopeptidase
MLLKIVCTVVTLIGLATLAPSASAAPSLTNRSQSPADVKRYWTPERMSSARDMTPSGLAPRSDGPSAPGVASAVPRHIPARNAPTAIGRIFFRWNGSPASCSGSVIDTRSQRVVLTAAHCLYLYGDWGSRYLFVPAYDRGRRPFGTYTWKTLWVTGPWSRNSYGGANNFDMGAIVVRKTRSGRRLGEVAGSLPYTSFPERVGRTKMYGYPAGANRARRLRQCDSRTWAGPWYSYRLPGPVGIAGRCNMASGSSGGPWMSAYHSGNGGTRWIVDGLTSTGVRNLRASPYFGGHFKRLLFNAENR